MLICILIVVIWISLQNRSSWELIDTIFLVLKKKPLGKYDSVT